MARDYDSQLLESVAVRRQRLREAVLFGGQRMRRRLDEGITKVVVSVCLAAVACAGTVGWSFASSQFQSQREEQEQIASGPVGTATAPIPADWVGAQVTFGMLVEEFDRAGVPADLYVLPDEPRPPADSVASYYLVTRELDRYSVSVIEFQQGRTGVEFTTEDETARWLYQELALVESAPDRLTAEEEQRAAEQNTEFVARVETRLSENPGDSAKVTLETGQIVDAFGPESGTLLFPDGMPFEERGLPEYARTSPAEEGGAPTSSPVYHRYRVIYPFLVNASFSPSAGRYPGGGVRYVIDPSGFTQAAPLPSIRWLLRNGYLERVEVTGVPE
ncbi:TNT domain-containing protein [Thermobifida halotolerans]|uniref:TNT domain-containing protein n=1 Tax=Thermobifida halotolerans TaxID=483545 RepID=A0A399FZS0_9ACTN|nr:TNT domain-containing protein [Thermobifida halotolerans]UOE19108.1 TNT domain-containing protein [Thermobifida halotolerans]